MKIVADENIPFVKECFDSLGQVELLPGRQITAEAVQDADALLVRSVTKVNRLLLDDSKIRFVATATIGTDHIDFEYLESQGIGFASAPGSNANSVAEYVLAAMLELAQRKNFNLQDKTVGIIGVGNVGSNVNAKLSNLGIDTILNDPPLARKTGSAQFRPIEEIFQADIITTHVPLTRVGIDKTFHLANAKFFDSLKPGCVFINTSRGHVVSTEAITRAVETSKVAAAVLDVWEHEPDIDVELLKMTDIATPHIAGYSFDGKVAGMIMIYKALCEHFGFSCQHTAADFLPKPDVEQIRLNAAAGSLWQLLADAVARVYDVTADHNRMLAMTEQQPEDRARYFSTLRKNYPTRREFQNTTVVLEGDNGRLASKFTAAGFKVQSHD